MSIEKKIHITWKTDDILNSNHIFIENCIKSLVSLADGWKVEINTDADIDNYLSSNLDRLDYYLLKDRHIVEKCDVWRLMKIYNEGGLYVDIDRLCNISLNEIVTPGVKVVLPTCLDYDFSHDFMCSQRGNPIFEISLNLNLKRRFDGNTNVHFLGPQTYFHGVTKAMFGESIDINPGGEVMDEIRSTLSSSGFVKTYREYPPYDTITFKSPILPFDHELEKRNFYAETNTKHWSGNW